MTSLQLYLKTANISMLQLKASQSHTARLTLETVDQMGSEVLPHPPYSPDLAPSDYLFGPMKKMLGGQKFASDTEVLSTVRQWLRQQPA